MRRADGTEREYPFRGRPKSNLTTQSNGKKIHELVYTWSSISGGAGYEVYEHPYASEIIERQYEVGGTYDEAFISEKVTTVTVDSYGTPTSIQTMTTEQSGANGLQAGVAYTDLVQHTQITNSTTNWCLGKPGTTQWINSYNLVPGAQITRTVDRSWDTGYSCRLNSEITEPASSSYKMTRSYGYDSFGNIATDATTGINMAARTTTVYWGTNGHFPQTVTNPEGEKTTIAWNYRFGLRSSVTDPNGESVSMLYDDFARLTQETQPDGTNTVYGLSACNAGNSYCGTGYTPVVSKVHVSSRAADASVIRYEEYFLDQRDRAVQADRQVLGGGLSRTRTIYDDHGRVEQQSVPDFSASPSSYVVTDYDLIGRPQSVTRPDNATTLYSYQGLKTVITDPLSKNTTKYADVKGRVIRSQDHAGYYQDFVFDAFGSLTGVYDSSTIPTLFTAAYAYGIEPMRTQSWDIDLGGWSYQPNALGEVVSHTDANGKTFLATFDKLSRPKSRTDPANAYTSATTTTWTWGTSAANNNIGKLVSIESGSHEESYTYDAYGRLSQRTTTADGTHLTNYSYNATSGWLETYTFPTSTSGVRVKLKYEYSYGFVSRISDFASPSTVFWEATAADARGRVIDETLENGLQSIRGYDAVTGLLDYIQTGTSGDKQDHEYTWNKVGSLTLRIDNNRGLTETFWYDSRHRLNYSELNDGQTTVQNLDVNYNAWGNITKKTDVCATTWTYDSVKKHAVVSACGNTFEYDENGNQTQRNSDDLEWYSYNYPSKLENGSQYHQFFYDGNRNRWKQIYNNGTASETTIYVGSNFEKRSEGGVTYYRHYIRAEGRLVAIQVRATDGSNENKTVLTDHLGSIVEILDESGNVDFSESFAAYGGRRDPADWSGPITNEADLADVTQRGFTAQTHLDASSLIHLGGRVLDAMTGRFLSPDPTVPHPGDTQSFNRYSYLRNDPLSGVDATGFFDSRFLEDWTFNIHFSRSHRRHKGKPAPTGCIVASPEGCYGKAGAKSVIEVIFDQGIGPLPSYRWEDDLVLYFQDPVFGAQEAGERATGVPEVDIESGSGVTYAAGFGFSLVLPFVGGFDISVHGAVGLEERNGIPIPDIGILAAAGWVEPLSDLPLQTNVGLDGTAQFFGRSITDLGGKGYATNLNVGAGGSYFYDEEGKFIGFQGGAGPGLGVSETETYTLNPSILGLYDLSRTAVTNAICNFDPNCQ